MKTFLTTRKMAPALATRIERSVGASHRLGFVLRVGLALVIAFAAYRTVTTRHRSKRELERARAELLDLVHVRTGALTPEELGFMTRVQPWLEGFARAYEGDFVDGDLRTASALEATLARPSVYVRGPVSAFATPAAIAETAASSMKDAFVLCLLDPPGSRAEKAVVSKVRAGYARTGHVGERTAHAHRLHDVEAGIAALKLPWEDRVRASEDAQEIAKIGKELARVPVEDTKRAVQADLLIVAMDEADASGPTELDGERAHTIRIGLLDARSGRVLLRLRDRVDPSWISQESRVTYASAMDACALAFDVRTRVSR